MKKKIVDKMHRLRLANTDIVNKMHSTDLGTPELIGHPEFGVRPPQPDLAQIRTKESIVFSVFVKPINFN